MVAEQGSAGQTEEPSSQSASKEDVAKETLPRRPTVQVYVTTHSGQVVTLEEFSIGKATEAKTTEVKVKENRPQMVAPPGKASYQGKQREPRAQVRVGSAEAAVWTGDSA